MKYMVVFGETGKDGKVVVSASKGDYNTAVSRAIDMGAGKRTPYESVFRRYEVARKKGDKGAKSRDVIGWAKQNEKLTWLEDRQEFVDLSEVFFRPVPPNTKLGAFEGRTPSHLRYKPKVRP